MPQHKIIPIETLPEKTAIAAYELVAKAFREQAEELHITLSNMTDDGDPIGDFEISIRKLEEGTAPCFLKAAE
jgi:hypothetical protein